MIDTDVLIDFLRGHPKAIKFVRSNSTRIILSSIVAAELYAGVKGEKELNQLDAFLRLFRIISVSPNLARTGALYKMKYGKSHGVGLADAIIAATTDAEQAELKTLNIKHYPMFPGLKPTYTK
jgi:predicted nucleic acid-binding protein